MIIYQELIEIYQAIKTKTKKRRVEVSRKKKEKKKSIPTCTFFPFLLKTKSGNCFV